MAYDRGDRRPKIFTYQLALRPNLDRKSRDCREISLLARCLDLLREGRLANLADTLAARLLAVETATRQGWATARHLEVFGPDEEGPVPPHILLSAQQHERQVEKAGGKGSWPRSSPWSWSDWTEAPPKRKGKGGKGQGKKGKAKGDKTGDADTKPRAADPSACWQGNDQAWQDGDLNKRWLHLEDSVVCLLILSKGRTSSHLLQPLCRQIGAVQLAAGSVLMLGM